MSALAEAILSAFDSRTPLTWSTRGTEEAIASFDVSGLAVEVTFLATAKTDWRVSFDVASKAKIPDSIRILSGVFQAVQEFLQVRQPERLVFAAKAESMGWIYETYLDREHTELSSLGYRAVPPVRSSPSVECTIEKITPSAWRD